MIEKNIKRTLVSLLVLLGLVPFASLSANEVKIVGAEFLQDRNDTWTVRVALQHADSGWDHYADIWRVVDAEGNVLGERVLLHPHENEQPFVRETNGVKIPSDTQTLYVEAHDLVHGWTANRLEVDMTQVVDGSLRVTGPE